MNETVDTSALGTSWHSYPSIFNMGHRAIQGLLDRVVCVEEKVDGSQFSFGYFPDNPHGELQVRSKGALMNIDAPMDMFKKGCETVKSLAAQCLLTPGWTYRGEFLAKPRHNALAYDRTPHGHVILFDINTGHETYMEYDAKAAEAARIGLEVVPRFYEGVIESVDQFRTFLDNTSVLGGQKIEGVVIKPVGYDFFGVDKKVLLGKFVSEAFREVHKQTWRTDNPTSGDVVAMIAKAYTTPARWMKAVQHLKDAGRISGDSVKDIGPVMQEIPADVLRECGDEIREALFKAFWPEIKRQVARGFPEYYKGRLLEQSFEDPREGPDVPLGGNPVEA